MSANQFELPVIVRTGSVVREIASVGDATDFLLEWTGTRHDVLAETLLRACYDVRNGHKSVETVEKGFRQFARRIAILDDPISVTPPVADDDGGGRMPI
ncbi:MAG: DUF982 domain-containing protein [Fulvimarina manganoxydans]|uniref:DUF982 domain-containing protein n=1 Tax=Fulvimarina manganoxydans TaxID=937218 RepID=UPI00235368FD|nr:DUF982 domain-containing protein [Fulvimarina manganoxydans]MCK5931021.1 DUF982 domain-containing protein [Fulvimarina manganoxydans]